MATPDGNAPPRRCVQGTVRGRVQGVAFRASMVLQAGRLGVRGWVQNRPDGSVAFHAEGLATAVDALLAWVAQGPPGARVDEVAVDTASGEDQRGFVIR